MLNSCFLALKPLNHDPIYFSYFINHYTKATTWEDPRVRYQQIGKPVSSSAASTSSKETTRHGGTAHDHSSLGGASSSGDRPATQVIAHSILSLS